MINQYFLRCAQSDFPELVQLGKDLGIITEYDGKVYGINGCDWDLVFGAGQLWEGPEGQKTLIVDADGNPYIHVNIQTRFSLLDRATELAAQSPELATAMQNMGKYFILGADGQPRRPNAPQCTF